jgi:hypothetical protein
MSRRAAGRVVWLLTDNGDRANVTGMDGRRSAERWPFVLLGLTTLAAIIPVGLLSTAFLQPTDPSCFEYCGLGQFVATALIAVISLAWLTIVLLVAWLSGGRVPAVAAAAALATCLLLLLMTAFDGSLWLTPSLVDSQVLPLDELVTILVMGVELPAVWRLAGRAHHRIAGHLAAAMTGLGTLAAAFAFVALGTTMFSSGPQVEYVAYLAFNAGLVLLAGAAWSSAGAERPGVALVGSTALCYAVIGGYYVLSPADSTAVLLLAAPIAAVGWLFIGWTWLRATRPVMLASA